MNGSERALALVAGIGNPDRGDDGFGPTVAQRLRGRAPFTVRVVERSGDALALIEEWNGIPFVIVIDAAAAISQPGRVHRLDLDDHALQASCEQSIRNHDPCISCAAHFLKFQLHRT